MARVMANLTEHHVVRYDRYGYGRSRGDRPPAGIDGHVEDLLALVEGHASPGERAVVVGHSYGGVVALAAGCREPDVVAAVGAFEAPLSWLPWWPDTTAGAAAVAAARRVDDPAAAADAFLRRMLGDDRWEAMPARARRDRRAEGPALVAELGALRSEPAPFDLAALPVPVVAGHGTRSGDHQQRAARELAASAGTSAIVIDGAHHGAHLSHPKAFADFVRAVVELAEGGGRAAGGT